MLRLVTTACAAPTALGRLSARGRGELNCRWLCGCTLDVVDASTAAGAATLGAGAIWKRRIRSKAARTGQLVGLSVGYAAENILRLAAYGAAARGRADLHVAVLDGRFFVCAAGVVRLRAARPTGPGHAGPRLRAGRPVALRGHAAGLIVIGAWAGRTRCWSSATGGCGGACLFYREGRRWRGGVLQGRLTYTWCCSC